MGCSGYVTLEDRSASPLNPCPFPRSSRKYSRGCGNACTCRVHIVTCIQDRTGIQYAYGIYAYFDGICTFSDLTNTEDKADAFVSLSPKTAWYSVWFAYIRPLSWTQNSVGKQPPHKMKNGSIEAGSVCWGLAGIIKVTSSNWYIQQLSPTIQSILLPKLQWYSTITVLTTCQMLIQEMLLAAVHQSGSPKWFTKAFFFPSKHKRWALAGALSATLKPKSTVSGCTRLHSAVLSSCSGIDV